MWVKIIHMKHNHQLNLNYKGLKMVTKGKTYEEFEEAMDRDNFMTSQEALEFGLVDEIIEKRQ